MFQRSRRLRLEPLEDRRLLSVASLGDAFTANTETSGDQLTFGQARAASVANDEDGNFVAVWSGESSESDGFDVFGQLFDSTGSPVGDEFQVNVATTSEQIFPAVAMDDDGDFVVTWSSLWQDSSLYGVYARCYDASGTAQGSEFRVNTTTDNNQNFSAVAMDADGDFTIAWTSTDQDGDKTGIYARRYSADGAATTEEIAVNTTTDGNQRYPVIGSDSVGGTIVVWTSEGQDGSSGGIFAQRLASDGTLVGGEFQVNTTTEGNQQLPSVAVSPGGNFLVSWQSFDLTAGEWMVYVQAYDADGAPVGTENVADPGRHVSAAITDVGDFVVAWEGESSSEAGRKEIHVQHFDPLGNANGAKTVYGSSDASLTAPSIAVQGDVAVILSTSTADDGQGSDIYGQRVQTSLTEIFNQPPVLTLPSDVTVEENEPIALTVSATDPDEPAQDLTFVLVGNPPSGAALDAVTGQFTWTPDESAGDQAFEITVRVTDSGSPPLSDQGVFHITVGEVNHAPILAAMDDVTVDEGSNVALGFSATDDDTPAQTLTYSIESGAPAEATIDANTGQLSWTPDEAYGGGQYTITVTVADDGTPSLSDSTSVTITVNETNSPPEIVDPGEQVLDLGDTLSLLLEADDPDEPANTVAWALDTGAPAGAAIDPVTGLLTWTPTMDDGVGSHTISVLVTDDGSPNESDSFEVEVVVETPMLDALADQIVDEETELSVQSVLTAPYDQATGLTFSLDSGTPAGAAIDADTGLFTWTPTEQQGPGEYTVTVRVTDDADSVYTDSESFTIMVVEVNTAPILAAISDQTVSEGAAVELTAVATDADLPEQTLTFSLDAGAPTGATIDPSTGEFSWTTAEGDAPGVYSITVRVTDDGPGLLDAAQSFNVTVADGNSPPVLASIADQTVSEGVEVQFTAVATDADLPAQALTFSLDAGAPAGASIDPVSGQFTWATTEADGPGEYPVTVRVTDDGLGTLDATQSFTITVTEINTVPVLAAISDQTVSEGATVELTAVATDADLPGQTLTFSLDAGTPTGATIDPTTGEFSWTTAEGDAPGVYSITVRVTDDGPGLLDAAQSFTITVTEGNTAPVLEPIADRTVNEGTTVSFTAAATDADLPAQTLTFSLDAGAPAGASIDPVSGQFTWATTEADGPGVHSLTVRVTDDGAEPLDAVQSFTITVTEGNTAPVLAAIADQTVTEGETVQFTAVASDTDLPAQTLTFSLDAGAPTGATINPATGEFSWTTAEGDAPGVYSITVRVSDDGPGLLDAAQSFAITVTEGNTAPVLAAIADQTVTEGETVQFTAGASDTDVPAQTLTFSLGAGAPAGATIDPLAGRFTWVTSEADGPGFYSITIRVTDDGPGTLAASQSFTITVEEANTAPVLAAIADRTITEGSTVQFQANATDGDLPAQSLTFSLDSGAPADAAIDPTTGWFTWSTTESDGPGLYSITIRVTDDGPGLLHDSETFTITVDEDNAAPVLAEIPDLTVTEGTVVEFNATATDSDLPAQTLTYSLGAGAPAGASIDPGTGQFTWSTTEADGPGFYSITVRVADNGPAFLDDTQSFTITVNEGNNAPVLATISDQTVTEGATVQFTVSATDGDVPTQSLAYSLDAGAPSGASINASTGQFTWTTTEADGPGAYPVTVRVTDNGSPALSDSQSFTVTVNEKNASPMLAEMADQTVTEGGTVQFTALATDGDVPAQSLTYSLDSGAPSGASINPSTGRFTWTTTETDGPGVYTITVRVTDDGLPALSDSESFTVTVNDKNSAPVLADIGDQTVTEGATVQFTASATDGDVPTQSLAYSLDPGAPAGASINATTGWFTWTTTGADGPAVYTITVRVTDDGSPSLSDSESFTVTVKDKNAAPVLADIGDQTVTEGATVQFTASAADSDVPAQSLTYSLESGAPSGASINAATGKFTWTTTETDGPGTYTITVRVADDGSPALSDSESFTVTVNEGNVAPVLADIEDQTVTEGTTVQFTASATDGDVPAQSLSYSLDSGSPAAASINASTGKFTWTTNEADAPGVYTITVRATDNGSPALSDTESFTVTVEKEWATGGDIAFSGSTAFVTGTNGNDKVRIELGATHVVAINDQVFSVDPSRYTVIEIDTGEGDDQLTLVGTASDESAILRPGSLQFTGTDCQVTATGTETIRAEGGGGNDVGRFYGTDDDDHLTLGPNWGQMIGTGFSLQLSDFSELHGIGGLEDHDTVEIFDSSGDDMFIGKPEYSTLTGNGYYLRVKWFDEVVAKATAGGSDEARLVDSDYDDLFVAKSTEASMTGPGYSLRTEGFETVHGYARCGGDDVAKMYDSAGDDTFKATPEYTKMIGENYYLRAKFFEQVLGYSTAGGNDIARFYDSAGDDTYTGAPTYAWLSGEGFFLRAKAFDQYRVQASEGNDVAVLHDSALDDLLTAGGNRATLSTTDQVELQMVIAFDQVTAQSTHDDDSDATNVAALDFLLTLEGSW